MTGTTRTSDGLDPRRRRALFRAWHRGIREMDLLLGTFADTHIGDLDDSRLDEFEALMELQDKDLLSWFTGTAPVAAEHDTPVFRQIAEFHATRHG